MYLIVVVKSYFDFCIIQLCGGVMLMQGLELLLYSKNVLGSNLLAGAFL